MKFWKLASVATALVLSSSANAALIERLGGLAYYDDVADLTWLADANAAQTSGYDADGLMDWDQANIWAAGLSVGGVDGWRLADSDTCYGYICSSSEMGNLFYNVLGGSDYMQITTTHNANYDLFSNVQSYYYWLATEYAPDTLYAGLFGMNSGGQVATLKPDTNYAWAVHSGDVSAVPVPAAVWLFGSGLIGLAGIARRKKA